LRTTVGDVDASAVELNRNAAERSNTVTDHERSHVMGGGTDCIAGLQSSRRRFSMDKTDHSGLFTPDEVPGLLVGVSFAPAFFKAHYVCAMTLSHFSKAVGEVSIGKDRDFRSGFDKVRNRGLHARAARAGDDQRGRFLRTVHRLKQLLHLLHHLNKIRIEMADNRLRQCLVDTGIDLGGAGAEEVAGGGLQWRVSFRSRGLLIDRTHNFIVPAPFFRRRADWQWTPEATV
jgi:hypothetical protein